MTRNVALTEAKKRTKGTRKNVIASGGVEPIPLAEWMELVEKKTEQIMGGVRLVSSHRDLMPRSTLNSLLSWLVRPFNAGTFAAGRIAL